MSGGEGGTTYSELFTIRDAVRFDERQGFKINSKDQDREIFPFKKLLVLSKYSYIYFVKTSVACILI